MDPFAKTKMFFTEKGEWQTGNWGTKEEDAPEQPWNGTDEFIYMEYLTGACVMGALSAAINRGYYEHYKSGAEADNEKLAAEVAEIMAHTIAQEFGQRMPDAEFDIGGIDYNVDYCVDFNDNSDTKKEDILRVLELASEEFGRRHGEDAAKLVKQLRDWGYEVTVTKEVKTTVSL